MKLTAAMTNALWVAAQRERGTLCPVIGRHGSKVNAAAEQAMLEALDRRGFIAWDGEPHYSIPRISEAGRGALIAKARGGKG